MPNRGSFKRIVIVAYRLPFKLVRKRDHYTAVQNSGGLVSAILSLAEKVTGHDFNNISKKVVWVGKGDNDPSEYIGHKEIDDYFEIKPVIIPDYINDKFYGGFCNDLIWPLFHYFPFLAVFDNSYYENYIKANRLFLDELSKVIQPGDFIWVHDYQLFLLPGMIREFFPDIGIAFFLHIPFPSYEIFRILPRTWKETLLKGMLGADLIGFHTNDYTQHFIKSVRRCLGCETTLNTIHFEGRICLADTFPIGINYSKFHDNIYTPETGKHLVKLRKQIKKHILIFSVDRLDYTKGFLQRLNAYELFLKKHKTYRGKVIFNMVIVPSRDNILRYQEMKKEIEATVGRINGQFSTLDWRPIIYQYKSLKFNEMVALYHSSDIALITPMRDGMNLVAKEYVASQHENPGVLILSEMAGAAAELGEAILVNPTDVEEVADAIYRALKMTSKEKIEKIERMQSRLREYDVFSWARDVFGSIKKVKIEQDNLKIKYFNLHIEKEITNAFKKARNAILIFDYDGTLVPIQRFPDEAVPEDKTLKLIETFAQKNKVVIVSGREQKFLERWFSSQQVYLIAEHGAFTKIPGGRWISETELDNTWKDLLYPIMQRYVKRCKGSFIEEKSASLCWHYRNADVELSDLRAIELREEINEVLSSNLWLQIIEGHKVIEVKKSGYNKGTGAKKLLGNEKYDFILAIGDDKTDEELFAALPSEAYTIKVGKESSGARYNIQKQSGVMSFLNGLL